MTRYRHYKHGTIYELWGDAKHTETLQDLVIYKEEGKQELWARPLNIFIELVEHEGDLVRRFKPI